MLVNAVVNALGVLGGLLGRAVTLLAAGDTLSGGIGIIVVGVGDLFTKILVSMDDDVFH